MTDTFRALCAELVDCLEKANWPLRHKILFEICLADARAALAQPEPQGPTDEELWKLYDEIGGAPEDSAWCANYARAVLARWGRPAIEPVPVSERWPEFSDCNPFKEVWAFNPVLDHWKLTRINQSVHTHWLPRWALPVPGVEGDQ